MDIVIETNNISKALCTSGIETAILNHINLEIKGGEFVAIMGLSGYGELTPPSTFGLLDNPTEGSYKLLRQEVVGLKERERTHVRKDQLRFVLQNFNLVDELNVCENVEPPLTYLDVKAGECKRMADDILKRMNIGYQAKHLPQQLSGRQQQRMVIACAVVTNPKLISAGEPIGNLDSKNGVGVVTLLTGLNKEGIIIVMATHSRHDASLAHRTVHLFDDSVVASAVYIYLQRDDSRSESKEVRYGYTGPDTIQLHVARENN